MPNPLFDIFLDKAKKKENGLLLFSAPTGSGKTHAIRKTIAHLLMDKHPKKILFVSHKKNTVHKPYEELVRDMKRDCQEYTDPQPGCTGYNTREKE